MLSELERKKERYKKGKLLENVVHLNKDLGPVTANKTCIYISR